MRVHTPPGFELRNRYQVLADADELGSEVGVPIGTLDTEEVEECEVKAVAEQKARKLVFAWKGRITTDSGAAESVMPKGMLVNKAHRRGAGEDEQGDVCGCEWGLGRRTRARRGSG